MQTSTTDFDIRNARIKTQSIGLVKGSLSSLKTMPKIDKKPDELKVKAPQFVDKIKALNNVSKHSGSAKEKLMAMRFGKTSKPESIMASDFVLSMKGKSYALELVDEMSKKYYVFNPEKIKHGLDSITLSYEERTHSIVDKIYRTPPISLKIADLQQYLKIDSDGIFSETTLNCLLERYSKAVFENDVELINFVEKLLRNLLNTMSDLTPVGGYIKGILAARAILMYTEAGKSSDFENLWRIADSFLPELFKLKLLNRVNLVKNLYEILHGSEYNRFKNIDEFLKTSMGSIVLEDKLKILYSYYELSEVTTFKEEDIKNQIELVKSVLETKITAKGKIILEANLKIISNYLQNTKNVSQKDELEALYNKIKFHAVSKISNL